AQITREILLNCTEEQIKYKDDCDLEQMKGMQAYIAIRAGNNTAELADDSVFKKWVISEQIGFVLFAPIMYHDHLVGVVGFDYRELQKVYAETSTQVIQGAAQLLAYVYAQRISEQERNVNPS
ncbi:MAG: hypothetical protein Q4G59_12700, partial [Planctomycetia bacterium]|nr:hypothetical protein [Planctomycetia bacterium]